MCQDREACCFHPPLWVYKDKHRELYHTSDQHTAWNYKTPIKSHTEAGCSPAFSAQHYPSHFCILFTHKSRVSPHCHFISDQPGPCQVAEAKPCDHRGVLGFLSLSSSFVQRKPLLVFDLSSECYCFLKQFILTSTRSVCFPPTSPTFLWPHHTGSHLRL